MVNVMLSFKNLQNSTNSLIWDSQSLPTNIIWGDSYSSNNIACKNATAFSVISGTIPTGLTFASNNGLI